MKNLTKWILGNVNKMLVVAGTSPWICDHSPGIGDKRFSLKCDLQIFGSIRSQPATFTYLMYTATHGTAASIECSPFFEFGAAGCGCFRWGSSALRFLLIWNETKWSQEIILSNIGQMDLWVPKAEMLHLDDTYRAILIQLWHGFFPAVLSQPEKLKKSDIFINKLVIKILIATWIAIYFSTQLSTNTAQQKKKKSIVVEMSWFVFILHRHAVLRGIN